MAASTFICRCRFFVFLQFKVWLCEAERSWKLSPDCSGYAMLQHGW